MSLKSFLAGLIGVIMVAGLSACAQPAAAGAVIQSEKPRSTAPANQTDLSTLVEGNNTFAFDLYKALDQDGNVFYSPYSISLALAMTYAGARGETAQQMADTLHYLLGQDKLHPTFNSLDTILAGRGLGLKGKDGKGFRLNVVNAIWGQQDYKFLSAYLDLLAQNYGAGLRVLDFVRAPEASRQTINDWVSQQTEQRIKDLIPQGAIDDLTRLVLTNAIYFNAAWQYPFNEKATQPAAFHLLDGSEVNVPTMHQAESFGYMQSSGYRAIELPYDGGQLSMLVLVPDAGQFPAFQSSLNAALVNDIVAKMNSRQVNLAMPEFEFDSSFSLAKTLAAMGMPAAFSENADFSGMTGKRDLYISDVIHKAFVSVDESGTEAAAATAVLMRLTAMPQTPIELTIDRPFIFLIRDIPTGTILFTGRVTNPGS